MNKKKIGFLIPSLNVGGSERVMSLLANVLSQRTEIEIHIITYGPDREVFYPLCEEVRVIQPDFVFDNRFRQLSTVRTLRFVRETIKVGQYDALLSFGERWNSFVMIACFGLDARIFLSDQSSPEIDLGVIQSKLRSFLYPRAAGLIAQTSKAREMALLNDFHKNIEVIPNPVIAGRLVPEKDRKNIVLTVGRLIATKHHDRLIRIFASLGLEDWELVIVGDDSQRQHHRESLIGLTQQLQVSDSVHLVGSQSDVQKFYDSAKVFAFTSSSEGLPNVVAEALAAGLPVVSYDCVAGPSDLIESGENGFLVDVFDDAAFQRDLMTLIRDDQTRKRMSASARNSISNLTPENIAMRFLRFMRCAAE